MKGSNVFLGIAVACFVVFFWSLSPEPAVLVSSPESTSAPPSESWLTLGNISGVCGILSLLIQVWQWRRA
jgi:hypothetical protein